MIQSHGAFDKKTIFSQEKYLTRKQKKFSRRFTVQKISPYNMLSYLYQEKEPARVLDMSEETLGLLLSHADVRPGGNYLLMDETGGLIVYALMERMQGQGTITLLHENDQPKLNLLDQVGFTEEQIESIVHPVNLLQFLYPEEERAKNYKPSDEGIESFSESKTALHFKRLRKYHLLNDTLDLVEENNFDGFISVCTLNPTTLLPKVLPRIGGSRSIVVYSQFKEILVGLNDAMMKNKNVLMCNIYESKVRKYQTIPGRLHPLMTSRAGGGYIFWGLRVFPKEGIIAVGRGMNKGGKKQKLNTGDAQSSKKTSKEQSEDPDDVEIVIKN
ncbi:unnamed protein product [Ambrosiozyma monospora]|uniref:Unnamed protein product n=1 Tax=Ambrosiozyma monospora TaxID=43982 RepID=A0ACB5SR61_AMBMO|nr:unnamed protein product [Ambrosiozyma monospora]